MTENKTKKHYAGIDSGSRTIKIVLLDEQLNMISSGLADQGVDQKTITAQLLKSVLKKAGIETPQKMTRTIATGYGRNAITLAGETVTEITCHARGVFHIQPKVRTVIDIGGQDSKVIEIDDSGCVRDFKMNDRCAAGTGRFLELTAQKLHMDLSEIGRFAELSKKPSQINSMCAVFAETEIIGLLASGEKREDIIAGVQNAVISRVKTMMGRHLKPPVVFTGGVAKIAGMHAVLESQTGLKIQTVPNPQMTGALGAALIAADNQ